MRTLKFILLGLLLPVIILSSCQKEDDEPTKFLLSRAWRPALVDKNTSSNPSGRILYDGVLDCQKDDSYQFGTNGVLTINQGTDKCDANEQRIKTVPYNYNEGSKELTIDGVKYTLADASKRQIKYYARTSPLTGYDYVVFIFE